MSDRYSCNCVCECAFVQPTTKAGAAMSKHGQPRIAELEALVRDLTTALSGDCWHPSHFILEEMLERDWGFPVLAERMGGDVKVNYIALEMYFLVGPTDKNLRLGRETAAQLSVAFGVSGEFFLNLETAWLAATDKREAALDSVPKELGGRKG